MPDGNKTYKLRVPYSVARLAQSVEHETLNLRVVGSSPTSGASLFFCLSFFHSFNRLLFFVHIRIYNFVKVATKLPRDIT